MTIVKVDDNCFSGFLLPFLPLLLLPKGNELITDYLAEFIDYRDYKRHQKGNT